MHGRPWGPDEHPDRYQTENCRAFRPVPGLPDRAGPAVAGRHAGLHRAAARGRLRRPVRPGRPEALPPRRRPPGLQRRRRRARLHLRAAARLRRRPHRRRRQHHPQAAGRQRRPRTRRRSAASRCRSASGSPSATPRSCSRWRSCSRSASRRWPGRSRTTTPTLHSATGIIGASVSGVFLWILGILNLVVLIGIVRVFREMRTRPVRRSANWRSSSTSAAS